MKMKPDFQMWLTFVQPILCRTPFLCSYHLEYVSTWFTKLESESFTHSSASIRPFSPVKGLALALALQVIFKVNMHSFIFCVVVISGYIGG